jgi:acyl-CoA thioesterase-1
MVKGITYLVCSFVLLISAHFKMQTKQTTLYLPLGDSYTIGTGAKESEAWPVLLAQHLKASKVDCTLLENPARNGFTTQDLINEELPLVKKLNPNFVTLLIGVNDWVRGVPVRTYSANLEFILTEIQKTVSNKRIILVTIPDFGVTPQGKNYGHGRNIGEGIAEFNNIIQKEAKRRNLALVDIFEISRKMADDNSLVAKDGLHPSAKEYAIWESMILPEALKLLK